MNYYVSNMTCCVPHCVKNNLKNKSNMSTLNNQNYYSNNTYSNTISNGHIHPAVQSFMYTQIG